MKLLNKKTGEIIESACVGIFKHQSSGDCERVDTEARSLEKVLEIWEDYNPKEPLIKSEKIRKIIQEWAELNTISEIIYSERKDGSLCDFTDYGMDDTSIEFVGWIPTLKDGKEYTISELCGKEEQ